MEYEVSWTQAASRDFANVLAHLETEWSLKVANSFFAETLDTIAMLKLYPQAGVASFDSPNVRRILITKHNALYYLLIENKIILLNIFDTRSFKYPR